MTALQEEEEGDKVAGDTQVEEALALWSLYTYTQQNYLLHLTHPWGVGGSLQRNHSWPLWDPNLCSSDNKPSHQ